MKLRFVETSGRDSSIIRLSGSDASALHSLHSQLERLSARVGESVHVDRLPGVESVRDCRLELESVERRPRSLIVRRSAPLDFKGQATCDDWITVRELLEPLLQSGSGFQWLLGGDARGVLAGSGVAFVVSTYDDDQT